MSVKSEPYYWLECDGPECGRKSTEYGDHTAWAEEHMAEEEAENGDWALTDEGKHFCPKHRPVYTCGAETYAQTRETPAEYCEEEVDTEDERCAKHDGSAQDRDDYDYEAWKEERRGD